MWFWGHALPVLRWYIWSRQCPSSKGGFVLRRLSLSEFFPIGKTKRSQRQAWPSDLTWVRVCGCLPAARFPARASRRHPRQEPHASLELCVENIDKTGLHLCPWGGQHKILWDPTEPAASISPGNLFRIGCSKSVHALASGRPAGSTHVPAKRLEGNRKIDFAFLWKEARGKLVDTWLCLGRGGVRILPKCSSELHAVSHEDTVQAIRVLHSQIAPSSEWSWDG